MLFCGAGVSAVDRSAQTECRGAERCGTAHFRTVMQLCAAGAVLQTALRGLDAAWGCAVCVEARLTRDEAFWHGRRRYFARADAALRGEAIAFSTLRARGF